MEDAGPPPDPQVVVTVVNTTNVSGWSGMTRKDLAVLIFVVVMLLGATCCTMLYFKKQRAREEQIGSQMNQRTSGRVVINVNSKEPQHGVPELKGVSFGDMDREARVGKKG